MHKIIKKIKSDDTFFFYRGRVALYATLEAMGVGKGDEVILQAFTCLAVPNPIVCLGAVPVYIDIDSETFNMDPSRIEEKINPKTKVIIVQHTFGIPAEMDEILRIAKKYGLYVIEDSCHTFGSKYRGEEVGCFGDASFYSFEWGKPLIIGVGGCVVVNNPQIKKRMNDIYGEFSYPPLKEVWMLRLQYLLHSLFVRPSLFWTARSLYRRLSKLGLFVGSFSNEELQGKISLDYKKKMSKWHEIFLTKKLNNLDDEIIHRKLLASEYEELLSKIGYKCMNLNEYYEPVYLRYPLLVENQNLILKRAREQRIELGDWYLSPIHPLLEEHWKFVNYQKSMCPVAEDVSNKIITLPIHQRITEKEIHKSISFLACVNNK